MCAGPRVRSGSTVCSTRSFSVTMWRTPPEGGRIEQAAGLLEVGDGDVPQSFYAQDFGAELAGRAAGGVAAVGVRMRDFRVDDQQDEPGRRDSNGTSSTLVAAVKEDGVAGGAAQGGGLVHDAGGRSTKAFSACWVSQDHVLGGKPCAGEFVQGRDDGAFNRVRGGQPGAQRDVGIEEEVEAGDRRCRLAAAPRPRPAGIRPAASRRRARGRRVGLNSPGRRRGQQPDGAVPARAGRRLARLSMAKGRTKPSL